MDQWRFSRGVDNPSATGPNTSSKVSRNLRGKELYDGFVCNAKSSALDVSPYILSGAGSKKMTGARAKLRIDDICVRSNFLDEVKELVAEKKVAIYPNLAIENIQLNFNNDFNGLVKINIIDLMGKTICSSSFVKNSQNTSWKSDCNFQEGIYIVMWEAGKNHGFEKVVIVKD